MITKAIADNGQAKISEQVDYAIGELLDAEIKIVRYDLDPYVTAPIRVWQKRSAFNFSDHAEVTAHLASLQRYYGRDVSDDTGYKLAHVDVTKEQRSALKLYASFVERFGPTVGFGYGRELHELQKVLLSRVSIRYPYLFLPWSHNARYVVPRLFDRSYCESDDVAACLDAWISDWKTIAKSSVICINKREFIPGSLDAVLLMIDQCVVR